MGKAEEAPVGTTFATNQQIIQAAYEKLAPDVWGYLVGGSESETTMRRNRLGFDSLALRQRVLVDVSNVDTSTTFLGHRLRIPVMTAPIGSLQEFTPEGGAAAARATARFGTVPFIGSTVHPGPEATAEASDGPKIFQLYLRGDKEWIRDLVARAKAAGYVALCLTVDSALPARRERQLMHSYVPPSNRADPRSRVRQAILSWDMLDVIRDMAGLPLIIKGIGTAEDARIALEHGVAAIYVSNHGGRALDHARGSIDILPEVVEAVEGKVEIVVDGSVQRGTDVLKALALGARAVTIGRMQGYGLAADGEEGLLRVLEILEEEVSIDMALLGTTSVDRIGRSHVCAAPPVVLPHEMSTFIHLPGGRLV
jgi:isopentenyl diphosphate isomerase/L-lactate dehydrogenase-like FMN-dependent dehydrogenase